MAPSLVRTCVLFTSGIRGKTRSLPETGGLLSLPMGRGTGPATHGKGGQSWLSTWQLAKMHSSTTYFSLSLCSPGSAGVSEWAGCLPGAVSPNWDDRYEANNRPNNN